MRIRITVGIIIFLLLGVSAERGRTTSIWGGGLLDSAVKSDVIATGTVTIKGGRTILVPDRILKGKVPKELAIINENTIVWGKVDFVEDEYVLLFLKSIDASSAELIAGGTAKWPQVYTSEYSSILSRASVESIARLVNQILRIESKTNIHNRMDILRAWLDSSDSLLNLIAMQYALRGYIWSKEPSPDYQTSIDRNKILNGLSDYAFKLIQSDDLLTQAEAIKLLRYADPARALPVLIGNITDSSKYIRGATYSVLISAFYREKMGDIYKYNSDDPPEVLLPIQRKWQEWYEANFGR